MMNIPQTRELLNLNGAQILVTGASGTIGGAIARRLAEAGARVTAQFHSDRPAGLSGLSGITPLQADLASQQGVDAMFEAMSRQGVALTGLVNNAADQSLASLTEISQSQLQRMFALNTHALVFTAQRFLQQLTTNGAIVNISSIEGIDPAPEHGHYAASKAALNMLSRSMAQEFGRRGVRVNTVSPGLIHRDGIEQQWPEGVARWRERAPLGRLGDAYEVADAVLFLLSPAARWISGANLLVDGGMSSQTRW